MGERPKEKENQTKRIKPFPDCWGERRVYPMSKQNLTLPNKGGYCSRCSRKKKSFKHFLNTQQGIRELKEIKKNLKRIYFTDHAWERYHERHLTALEVKKVFQKAWLVERQDSFGKITWVLLVYMDKDPVHLVVKQDKPGVIAIITIYDPKVESWRWSNDFKHRACWCYKKRPPLPKNQNKLKRA